MSESSPHRDPFPLRDRTALVTGASRRSGIGFAVARRLAAYGASVHLHHHTPHDAAQPWGADPDGPEQLAAEVRDAALPEAAVTHGPGDLAEPAVAAGLVDTATAELGAQRLDILVANHGLSGHDGPLVGEGAVDAATLDLHWAVNTRSALLLAQAFARQPRPARAPQGSVVFLTSGQDVRGGMPDEVAYALAKGALSSTVRTLATALGPLRINVNAVNPGPVDTGYLHGTEHATVAGLFPGGEWAVPDTPARLISWLVTDEAGWITGEVINSEGGFARWPKPGFIGPPQ